MDPNYPYRLDDYTIKIDLPTREDRRQIFALHARKNGIVIEEALFK